MLVCSVGRCTCTVHGPVFLCQVNHTRFRRRRLGGLPSSWQSPVIACPGLRTPAAPNDLALAVVQILPSAFERASASATMSDFGAESSRPATLLSTLQPPSVTTREARLDTGLPATALTGLDLHQLDSFERFHQLISNSPFPNLAWRDG